MIYGCTAQVIIKTANVMIQHCCLQRKVWGCSKVRAARELHV